MIPKRLIGTFALGLGLSVFLPPAFAEPSLRAIRVSLITTDPDARYWSQEKPTVVPMLPQNIAIPTNLTPAIKSLQVKTAHDGATLAVRLEWRDPTKDDVVRPDRFGDQVAVEVPLDQKNLPSPMMGHTPGGRVNIWQWRATLQHDVAHGPMTVHELYPNALVDLYPDQVLRTIDAKAYSGALGVENPVSRPVASPVLDQIAEGFGSLTTLPEQHVNGKGIFSNGTWRVVITHPLSAGGGNNPRLLPGGGSSLAFAVWEGGHREVGARKAWANWVPMKLAP